MWSPQRPKFWSFAGDFGFWILGILDFGFRGFWIFWILDFGFWGFWILDLGDFGFWGRNPKSKIPQSKIQNPNFFGRFWGFWILDFGPLCSKSLCGPNCVDFGFWIWGILDFGFGDFGFWILGILDFGDFGFWILGILDFGLWGFWILDFGPLCSKSLCEAPNAPNLGILNFGFWGFWGFWILDFGDFGFWILRLGGWKSLGAKSEANVGFYIRVRRLCTPPRVGGLFLQPLSTFSVIRDDVVWRSL